MYVALCKEFTCCFQMPQSVSLPTYASSKLQVYRGLLTVVILPHGLTCSLRVSEFNVCAHQEPQQSRWEWQTHWDVMRPVASITNPSWVPSSPDISFLKKNQSLLLKISPSQSIQRHSSRILHQHTAFGLQDEAEAQSTESAL